MNFTDFKKLPVSRSLKFQRCVYIVSPANSPALGPQNARFVKIGISRCNLWSRLSSGYLTCWHNLIVHAVAIVRQNPNSEKSDIMTVESDVVSTPVLQQYRIRKLESFMNPADFTLRTMITSLRDHPSVHGVWVPLPRGGGTWSARLASSFESSSSPTPVQGQAVVPRKGEHVVHVADGLFSDSSDDENL